MKILIGMMLLANAVLMGETPPQNCQHLDGNWKGVCQHAGESVTIEAKIESRNCRALHVDLKGQSSHYHLTNQHRWLTSGTFNHSSYTNGHFRGQLTESFRWALDFKSFRILKRRTAKDGPNGFVDGWTHPTFTIDKVILAQLLPSGNMRIDVDVTHTKYDNVNLLTAPVVTPKNYECTLRK